MTCVCHSQETSYFSSCFGRLYFNHIRNSFWIWSSAFCCELQSKECNLFLQKFAFLSFTFKFKAARRFRQFCNASSCSFRVLPWIKISSIIFFTPRMSLRFCCSSHILKNPSRTICYVI